MDYGKGLTSLVINDAEVPVVYDLQTFEAEENKVSKDNSLDWTCIFYV